MGAGPSFRVIDANRRAAEQLLAEQRARMMQDAAVQPIPGLTGPRTPMPGGPLGQPQPPGMAPMPQQGMPFMFSGPYGAQAAQLAGVLGQPAPGYAQPPGGPLGQPGGMGGWKRIPMMNRPPGK